MSDPHDLLRRLAGPIKVTIVQRPKCAAPETSAIPNGAAWNAERDECARVIQQLLTELERK